jgi:YggT family protein
VAIAYLLVDGLFTCYMIMLIARVLGSWFPQVQEHPVFRFIAFYTDPYLNFFRRIIPPLGMVDISPIVAFFALQLLELIVKGILFR